MTLHDAPPVELIDRPQSYQELTDRPNFLSPVDHTEHSLKDVLTDYHFKQWAPCGLKGCRQPHKNGLLVITEDGVETNIGQDCGRTHFGDTFTTAHADYARRRERADLIARAKSLQADAPALSARIKDVVFRDYGGKWVRKVEAELTAVIGAALVESLGFAHVRGELQVIKSTERTEEEIESVRALNPSMTRQAALYASEVLGTMEAMPWIGFDFRQRLMVKLHEPLQTLLVLEVDELTSAKLKSALKQFDALEGELSAAEAASASAVRFLAEDNLKLVALWLPERHQTAAAALREWPKKGKYTDLLKGTVA